ncbi:GntR family transcriptional regulator [Kribbella sp. NPDC050124]|uniref:GntR family transcriptional regulator n=1 Tax=Kribbella sp. NPDC050124 TaxID=3364114 RepID=UPI0037A9BFD6
MARPPQPRKRQRGNIDALPSGSLRVRVYAGVDPISKKPLYLTETVPPGPRQAREAEQARTRLLNQVDEKRNPKTRATVAQLMERYLPLADVEPLTRRSYESKYEVHIRPLLGSIPLSKLDTETLDSFYAELRRCRKHCRGKAEIDHRTDVDHLCDEHQGRPCRPADPETCRVCRRACKPHVCRGLSNSSIRQIHWCLSGALQRAISWKYISVNPADQAEKPSQPRPEPRPPTATEAALLINAAFEQDADWGTFVWTKATLGARRGEMCALRIEHLDLGGEGGEVINIRQSIYKVNGQFVAKDTKTHQHRRIVPDPETAAALRERIARMRRQAAELGAELSPRAFVFSPSPDGLQALKLDTATQRYKRMATRLGINTTLKNLRHFNATELISAGVDPRTVAGRLGHGGGGATTLRVYSAWSAEADQRAATRIAVRMPPRPLSNQPAGGDTAAPVVPTPTTGDLQPYERIAADLRGAIDSGVLMPGATLPSVKDLAARYKVAPITAHRALSLLSDAGLVAGRSGQRKTVAAPSP